MMLDVGDADAIIVHLTREDGEHLVILVDGGHPGDAGTVLTALKPILEKAGKAAPDLIVCTHYDDDHIGGLLKVCQAYGKSIGCVWIHEHQKIKEAGELAAKLLEERKTSKPALPIKNFEDYTESEQLETIDDLTLESYQQMVTLLNYLTSEEINHAQPFQGTAYNGWPITVLGPTVPYYNECLDKIKSPAALLLTEKAANRNDKGGLSLLNILNEVIGEGLDACGKLAAWKKTVTPINLISIIFQIVIDGKKYLFTGDAGLDSLQHIPDYNNVIANLYWLKVPHHGSKNNSSPDMITLMKPEFADISGGQKYLSPEVQQCFIDKGVKTRATKDEGNLTFPYPAK